MKPRRHGVGPELFEQNKTNILQYLEKFEATLNKIETELNKIQFPEETKKFYYDKILGLHKVTNKIKPMVNDAKNLG